MSIYDVLDMPFCDYDNYEKYIPIIEARERLQAMDVASYPNASDKWRKETHKKLFKIAYPSELDNREVLTTDQMMIQLSRLSRGK